MGKGARIKGYMQIGPQIKSFHYNPEEFEYGYSSDYAVVKAPGSPHPVYQFVGGNERTITTTLLLDGREKGQISEWENFLGRTHPVNRGYNMFSPPPSAIFAIGPFVKKVIIRDVVIRYTQFNESLVPIKAEIDLTMETIM